jgi:hypothetical protein
LIASIPFSSFFSFFCVSFYQALAITEDRAEMAAEELHDAKDPEASTTAVSELDTQAARQEFLSRFTAEDDRRIMRKVDWRFLPLMGFMYLLKQIDFSNAASIKVLQVGEASNVLTELHMTANQYNWIQTIYYVCLVCQ